MTLKASVPFGEQLRCHRETAGLTQERLAERAGLSVQGIAALESGRSQRPYPHTLRALAEALALSPDDHAALVASAGSRQRGRIESHPESVVAPLPLSSVAAELIGREGELRTIRGILQDGVKILTLTGPGGVGKTSLAVHLARNCASQYPDGVTFVDLAPLSDAALVPATIMRAFQLPKPSSGEPLEILTAHLSDKRLLLVLDNFEQVLAAAPGVAFAIQSVASVTALVTSRGPLRVRGEREYPVPPLDVPALVRIPGVADVAGNAAVALFVERAQAMVPGFQLNRENAAVIAAISRRLDGLPLAIELAAARVRVLDPMALLARLDSVLPLLSAGARDLPERQRTMRRAIEWSYNLLDESARALFPRLSVFRGGWTIDAAEAVGFVAGVPAGDVVDALSSLVEQSLVVTEREADGSLRYRFLVPIREFAETYLEQSGQADDARRRHAAFYHSISGQAAVALTGPLQIQWLARLEKEHDNVRLSLEWLLENREWDDVTEFGWNLWVFWWIRNYHAEGRRWMSRVLDHSAQLPPVTRARALGLAGAMALGQGDIAFARAACWESRTLFRTECDEVSAARSELVLGLIDTGEGNARTAADHLREASGINGRNGAHFWAALATSALGMLSFRRGDFERAGVLLQEGYELSAQAGDRFSRYITLYNLARLAQERKDVGKAAELYQEGLAISLEAGDRANLAYCMEGLAAVAATRGDFERAAQLLGGAGALFEAVGLRVYTYRPDQALREQTIARVRSRLDDGAWTKLEATGAAMSLDDLLGLAASLVGQAMQGPPPKLVSTYGLTPREIEILRFIITHHSDREIADILYISPRTVGTHMNAIRNKMGVASRREAARIAAELGLS
jgi:predicted ATPase/DNA-binding CsgD family transcriptional regulator/DNA-binding XRE family transcriptional regulator